MSVNFGLDADRVLRVDTPLGAIRRRLTGRYAVDEFGGDPHLMDLLAGVARLAVTVDGADRVPRLGPALLVANRGVGVLEPLALIRAVRDTAGRRLRVVGAPELPVVGDALRTVGAIGYRADDVAAMLRAGHLTAAPLSPTWLQRGPGEPPRRLVAATLGFPLLPVAVQPGFPLDLPGRRWRVRFGAALQPPPGTPPDDRLVAAELADAVRDAVRDLLEDPR